MTDLDPRQRELAAALRETLNRAAAQSDPLLDAALAATRAQLAARPPPHRNAWWLAGGFAVAAGLAIIMVLPFSGTTEQALPAMAKAAPMPDADLQLLEDMDMLVAMSDERHEG